MLTGTCSAFLIAWCDEAGRVLDAGIYSEETPTTTWPGAKPRCIAHARSRFSYTRARDRLRHLVAETPKLHWVYGMASFAQMERQTPFAACATPI